jgi:4-hydroxy-tetrahydrodipicolinate synthase
VDAFAEPVKQRTTGGFAPLAFVGGTGQILAAMAPFSARGAFTALVTPFTDGGTSIDWPAYERLLEAQIAGGIVGLVPCGTTGESPTLSEEEKSQLVRRALDVAHGRARVVAGIGTNDTRKAIAQAHAARDAGADAVMLVMPSYSRPSQAGLADYIEQVARAAVLPVVIYNVPGRTAVGLDVDTLLEAAARCDNVVALKDATGSVGYCQSLLSRNPRRLQVLCGDDSLTVPMMSVGAQGVISVTSNVLPGAVASVVTAMLEGRLNDARLEHLRLLAVHDAMFCAPSPGPVKAALAERGCLEPLMRPPMDLPTPGQRARVMAALQVFEA